MYGAAHLVSSANVPGAASTSYLALYGGISGSRGGNVAVDANATVCLLELGPAGTQWLQQPVFNAEMTPPVGWMVSSPRRAK